MARVPFPSRHADYLTTDDLRGVAKSLQVVVTGAQIGSALLSRMPPSVRGRVDAVLHEPSVRASLDDLAVKVGRVRGRVKYGWNTYWPWALLTLPADVRARATTVEFDLPPDVGPDNTIAFLTSAVGDHGTFSAAWQPTRVLVNGGGDSLVSMTLQPFGSQASSYNAQAALTVAATTNTYPERAQIAARVAYALKRAAARSSTVDAVGLDVASVRGIKGPSGRTRAQLCDDIAKGLDKDDRVRGRGEARLVRIPLPTLRYFRAMGTPLPVSHLVLKLGELDDEMLQAVWWQLYVPWREHEAHAKVAHAASRAKAEAAREAATAARVAARDERKAAETAHLAAALDKLEDLPPFVVPGPGELPRASEHEIPLGTAVRAYEGTSFSSERRGESLRKRYAAAFNEVVDRVARAATSPDRIEYAADALADLKRRYRNAVMTWLARRANVTSWMITGRSGRNERRERKKSDSADRAAETADQVLSRGEAGILKHMSKMRIAERGGQVGDLARRIQEAERAQEMMKAVNRVVRSKKLTHEQKIARMVDLGLSEKNAHDALTPDFMGGLGFPSYALTNNNANIRRMREKLKQVEQRAKVSQALAAESGQGDDLGQGEYAFTAPDGTEVTVEVDADDERVRLRFPKEAVDFRGKVKARGFRWSRRHGAWQRKNTVNTLADVTHLLGLGYDYRVLVQAMKDQAR